MIDVKVKQSTLIRVEGKDLATLVIPALPIAPGDWRISFLRKSRWFIAFGLRKATVPEEREQ